MSAFRNGVVGQWKLWTSTAWTRPHESLRGEVRPNLWSVTFEVLAAVTMKNVVCWDINPSSYRTEDTLRLHYRAQPVNAM
jgi:hypothetical protein